MNRLGIILSLVFVGVVLAWGGFIAGRSYRESSIRKCGRGFGECMILLERMESRLNQCRLKLPGQ